MPDHAGKSIKNNVQRLSINDDISLRIFFEKHFGVIADFLVAHPCIYLGRLDAAVAEHLAHGVQWHTILKRHCGCKSMPRDMESEIDAEWQGGSMALFPRSRSFACS